MINKKILSDFIKLDDLPPIYVYLDNNYFLKIYRAILNKGGGKELMAKYICRKPMSVKKKLKSIIKQNNKNQLWSSKITIKNIQHLEECLLDGTLNY